MSSSCRVGSAEAGWAAAKNKYIGMYRKFLDHDNLHKGMRGRVLPPRGECEFSNIVHLCRGL